MSRSVEVVKLFQKSLASICPKSLSRSAIQNDLYLRERLDSSKQLFIVGYGKAAAGMTTVGNFIPLSSI